MNDIAVVIPNFNGRDFLPDCLRALEMQTVLPDELLVVDNASTDGSAEIIEREFPHVRVLRLPRNTGFGVAANCGVSATRAERICILNSDTEAEAGWLSELLAAPRPNEVWAWGTTLLRRDGMVESAGDLYNPAGYAYKAAAGSDPERLPSEPYQVFAAPGAAPLFRRDVYLELGGYDETFFLYYEDIDLAFRALLAGYVALQVPRARVKHRLGASGVERRMRYLAARNGMRCAVRNLPGLTPRKVLSTTRREARWARQKGHLSAFTAGRVAALRYLPRDLRQRRTAMSTRRATDAMVESMLGDPPALRVGDEQ